MTYFLELGKILAAELAKNPVTRQAADNALNRHLGGGRMAQDALPRGMRPRGGYDQEEDMPNGNGGGDDPNCIDSQSCLMFVHKLLTGLPPEEQDKFLEGLANLLQSDDAVATASGVNASAMDARRRSVRRSARDTGMRRPAAMDSNIRTLNDQSFARRWPDAAKVNSWFGRY